MRNNGRFGPEGWATIVASMASLAIYVTPGIQSWYAAVPLWLLAGAAAVRWVQVVRSRDHVPVEEMIMDVTEAEIRKPFETFTSIEARAVFEARFRGKRMRISGTVQDVSKHQNLKAMRYGVNLKEYSSLACVVNLWFPSHEGGRVAHLRRGAPVVVVGTIFDANAHRVELRQCSIVP